MKCPENVPAYSHENSFNPVSQVESYLTGSGGVTSTQMSNLKDSSMTSTEWENMVNDWQNSAGYSQSQLASSAVDGYLKTGNCN